MNSVQRWLVRTSGSSPHRPQHRTDMNESRREDRISLDMPRGRARWNTVFLFITRCVLQASVACLIYFPPLTHKVCPLTAPVQPLQYSSHTNNSQLTCTLVNHIFFHSPHTTQPNKQLIMISLYKIFFNFNRIM